MKKLLLALLVCLGGSLQAQETIWNNITPAVTTLTGASTNTANGNISIINNPKDTIRIYVTANGIASTTNGTLIVKFSTASGDIGNTNEFDTASASNIKITMSTLGTSTNTVSDWFQVRGVRYIRAGQIENTFVGPVSNLVIRVGTVSGGQQ